MIDSSAIYPAYVLSGFVVGFLVGMAGVGGGALMTPLLIILFNVHPITAVGTDLLYACITKSVGSAVHSYNRNIDWHIVGHLAVGSLPASLCTIALLNLFLIDTAFANVFIDYFLGIALLGTALALVFRPWLMRICTKQSRILAPERTRLLTVLMGAFLGIVVTITSVGAGAICVTALVLLYPKLPVVRIAATDLAHAVPLTLFAGLGHLFSGTIDLSLMGALLTGSLPGIVISSLFAPRVPDAILRFILATILTLIALKLLL